MINATVQGSVERLVDAGEAAVRLGVDLATLGRWRERGAGPRIAGPSSGRLAYWSYDLEEWQDRLGSPREVGEETVVGSLPDGCLVFHVLRAVAAGQDRFEIRRGRRVLASFISLRGVCDYVVHTFGAAARFGS